MADSVLKGRSVLITGGAGFFGKAFVRRALDDGARRVAVYSRSESRQAEMRVAFPDERMRYFIGDVRDPRRLCEAMRDVDFVIHAAALKRVEVCEADPGEAKRTNIDGTENVARAAIACGVQRAVYLSTDKAAAPNTHYGTTKLAGERLWNGMNVYAAGTSTKFAATRYGNVVGSTGSVVPLWKAQAARGEPLTITDPQCTRFLMSMDEAVGLVLFALEDMRGGEVYVPCMRATSMAELAAVIAPDHPTVRIGLRPGEKLHETLITEDEWPSCELAGGLNGYPIWALNAKAPEHTGAPAFRSDVVERFNPDDLRALVAA